MSTTRTYECTLLVNSGQAQADYDGTVAAVRGLYEGEGATWIEFEKWEDRRLAYPISGETSATYFFGYFEADSEIIGRIERRAGLSDLILRQLIVVRDGSSYDRIREQRAQQQARAEAAVEE